MRLDVITIFPDYLAPLGLSLIGKARSQGLIDLRVHDLRDFTHDRHRTVDDTPYGGGAGMVMRPEPWGEAIDHVLGQGATDQATGHALGHRAAGAAPGGGSAPGGSSAPAVPHLIVPDPSGTPFTQGMARALAAQRWLAFACGRYEGIDERVYDHARERMPVSVVSLGDFVLNGGEVAVMAMIEAVVRLVPGVLGNPESLVEESHEDGLLEYPVYTKPASWRGHAVPEVLLSGNHQAVDAWRRQQRLARTADRRPDLLHPSWALDLGDGLALAPATLGDAGELLTLQRACWVQEAQANDTLDIPALGESLDDVRLWLGRWQTYVVRSAGRLVGSVRGQPTGEHGEVWEIGRLMVAADLQGRGLGRRLLEHMERCAPQSAGTVRLVTGAGSESNLRMYRKAGYRAKPGERDIPGAVVLTKRRRAE